MASATKSKKRLPKGKKAPAKRPPKAKGSSAGESAGGGELLDMEQAIQRLKTTRPTFYRWLRSGKIRGMKVGRQWRFYEEDIEHFLKGEEPRIELSVDIGPLIDQLQRRYEKAVGKKNIQQSMGKNVIAAVNAMLMLAAQMRASDLHLESHVPKGGPGSVAMLRYRIDGVLHPVAEFDARLLAPIMERFKMMARCDPRENKKPQDGRIELKIGENGKTRTLDLRVSFVPALFGEALTARLLDPAAVVLDLSRIDFAPRDQEKILRALDAPWGLIALTGPTGSGKTTVLYSCLNRLAGPERKVMTAENPVEYALPWMVQIPVHPGRVPFPAAVRSMLRSDPDVLMIGEIRDGETLQVAMEASLTGHLVLTTLHTDEAASALIRMVDIGVDPFVVREAVKLIVAQRLVRRLCPDCSKAARPPEHLLEQAAPIARSGGLGWENLNRKFRSPVGCKKCAQTGYRGRTVIAETLEVTPEIGAALQRQASVDELRALAVGQGMTTMAAAGVRRAAEGQTTLEEVIHTVRGPFGAAVS